MDMRLGLGSRVAVAAAGGGAGGGAPVTYIDDPLTDDSLVNTYVLSGSASWGFTADGVLLSTGGVESGVIVWDGEAQQSPVDNGSLALEWQSVVSTGQNYTGELRVMVRESEPGVLTDWFSLRTADTTATLRKERDGFGETVLATETVARIAANDVLRLEVTPNGSNFDIRAYKNDVKILEVLDHAHGGTLGRKSAYYAAAAAAGWNARVRNALGVSVA